MRERGWGGESSGWHGHPRVFLFYVNTMYTTLGARRELSGQCYGWILCNYSVYPMYYVGDLLGKA